MAALEKHPKIRQHQPQIASEKKINRKTPTGMVQGTPLQNLSRTLGNRGLQRLVANSSKNEQQTTNTPPALQRSNTAGAKPDAATAEQAKAVFEKAQAAYYAGDYAQAAETYQQASDILGGTNGGIFFNIAQCHRKLNNFSKAIEFYQKFIQKSPTSEYVQEARQHIKNMQGAMQPFLTGVRLYNEGDYASAAIWFSRALEVLPSEKKPLAYFNLGQANRMLRRYAIALSYYERYVKLSTTSDYIGEAQQRIQEMRSQIGVNQEIDGDVMAIDKDAAREIFGQAAQAYLEKRYEEAMNLYMEVMQEYAGGSHGGMLYNIAQCNRKLGRKATAIHFYERALDEGIAEEYREECKQKIADLRKALGWPDKEEGK